jgi:hypothetical protein
VFAIWVIHARYLLNKRDVYYVHFLRNILDGAVGAAVGTGDGDHMLKYCPSFHIVQKMRDVSMSSHAHTHTYMHVYMHAHAHTHAGILFQYPNYTEY